jgi:NADH-quinone oxidoreductase subunit H
MFVNLLSKFHLPESIAMIIFPILPFCIIAAAMILIVLILVLAERKILGFFTQRKGPNRVGLWGLFQTIADAIKLLCKEDIIPAKADKFMFSIAPLISFIPVMVIWGLIPYCSEFNPISSDVGLLLFASIACIPILGNLMAGYASNNKYSIMGSMRAVAQCISYELPLVFVLVSIVVLSSSLNLNQIVLSQTSASILGWNIFPAVLGFLIFFICALAELNRCPFDLSEAESELVSGYSTEYSGMKFAFFYLAEYAMMFSMCAFIAILFFGGYLSPLGFYISERLFGHGFLGEILVYFEQVFWLMLKTFVLVFIVIWVRAVLPRLKVNDLMNFAWKILIPLSMLNLVIVCIYKYCISG